MAQVCLKNSKTGEVIRMEKFVDAPKFVQKNPDWSYCSRTEWRIVKGKDNGTQN